MYKILTQWFVNILQLTVEEQLKLFLHFWNLKHSHYDPTVTGRGQLQVIFTAFLKSENHNCKSVIKWNFLMLGKSQNLWKFNSSQVSDLSTSNLQLVASSICLSSAPFFSEEQRQRTGGTWKETKTWTVMRGRTYQRTCFVTLTIIHLATLFFIIDCWFVP